MSQITQTTTPRKTDMDTEWPKILFHRRRVNGKEVRKLYPFNPANIVYEKPQHTKFNSDVIRLFYNLNSPEDHIENKLVPIILQTPVMDFPFGLSAIQGGRGTPFTPELCSEENVSVNLNVSFRDSDTKTDVGAFLAACQEWDRVTQQTFEENWKEWFPSSKTKSKDIHLFLSNISDLRTGKDGKVFAPTLKCKVKRPRAGEPFNLKVYRDQAGGPPLLVDLFEVKKRSSGSVLLRHNGLWCRNGKVPSISNSFVAMQVKLAPDDDPGYEFEGSAFVEDETSGYFHGDGY